MLTIPLQIATLVFYQIRPRDWPGPFLVGWATYFFQGFLTLWCDDDTCALPYYVDIVFICLVCSTGACLYEVITGKPFTVCIIPVIMLLAPGGGAVRATLGSFHRKAGDKESNTDTLWESLVLEGVLHLRHKMINDVTGAHRSPTALLSET